jgi:hypothetical protein
MVYAMLYPSENVSFAKLNLGAITANQTALPYTEVLYTEPIGYIALRGLGIALAYNVVFLVIAWVAFKKTQINE